MPRRRLRSGISEAAYAASDVFGNLLGERIRAKSRAEQQAREAPMQLGEYLTKLAPSVAAGHITPDAAGLLYQRVADSLGMSGPQDPAMFQQFAPPPADPFAGVTERANKADFRERVPTDVEVQQIALNQQADPTALLQRLAAMRQSLPPLREPGQGSQHVIEGWYQGDDPRYKGKYGRTLMDAKGATVGFVPGQVPQAPRDSNAPKPFREDPTFPLAVQQYVFDLGTKKDDKGIRYDEARAIEEVARKMPQLLQAHPQLDPIKVKQAISTMYRKGGQSLVIPAEALSGIFGK
jgi:hypothetical protein